MNNNSGNSGKNGFRNILLAGSSLIFAGIIIFVVYKITQRETNPVSPNSPTKTNAQSTSPEGCIPCEGISFTISGEEVPSPTTVIVPSNTPIPTPTVTTRPTSTPFPTATPTILPTSTVAVGQPTSTPKSSATPTVNLIAQINPTSPPSGGVAATSTPRPTDTAKTVTGSALPDAGFSAPTLILQIFGGFLLLISILLLV